MNVFEFLGLPANHRSDEKVTHKVKNLHEVPVSKIKFPALAQTKADGISAICVITSFECGIFTRTGKRMTNVSKLEQELWDYSNYNHNLINTVVFAELCNGLCSLEVLGGWVSPNRKEELTEEDSACHNHSYLTAFDFMPVQEFIDGESKLGYQQRHVEFLSTASGIRPVPTFQVESMEEFERLCDTLVHQGEEGAVLKQMDFIWKAGKKDYCQTKKVRGVDYDLEVVDVEEGKGKREGTVANLLVRWRDFGIAGNPPVVLSVDGCFSDNDRSTWYHRPSDIIGKIVHVHALQIGSKGSLRLAKVKSVRIDKTVADL